VIISKKTSAAPLPFAISHGTLIPMGFSSTLDDALSQSVEHAINVRKKLDKVLMGGKFAEQAVVNPTAFQECHVNKCTCCCRLPSTST